MEGVYEDQAYPRAFVLIGGSLRARHIITGAQLEIHGDLETRHLVGDYNDYSAMVQGKTTATTFYPENHHFELSGGADIALELEGRRTHSLDLFAPAFVADTFVDSYGAVKSSKELSKALALGEEILVADPRNPSTARTLDLVERELEELPPSLSSLSDLEELNLDDNELTSLDGIEQLRKLRKLSIVGNPLEGLPQGLTNLPLRDLNVGYYTELPDWFDSLRELETLGMVVEELESLPLVVSRIPNLKRLELADWPFDWKALLTNVVSMLGKMRLEELRLSGAKISNLPNDLSSFVGLKRLELSDLVIDSAERSRIAQALPNVDLTFE